MAGRVPQAASSYAPASARAAGPLDKPSRPERSLRMRRGLKRHYCENVRALVAVRRSQCLPLFPSDKLRPLFVKQKGEERHVRQRARNVITENRTDVHAF